MAESFEKLDNISRGWAKAKLQKRLAEAFKQVREAPEEERQSHFL